MIDVTYWLEEAMKFAEEAKVIEDPRLRQELLELADACKDVAADLEQRASSG
ncbi:MAG: hypothetical protein ACLQJR_22620 [Stellaceae bacterium]